MNHAAVTAIQNQFESTLKMLKDLISVTPDSLWYSQYQGIPIWQQIFHVVYFIDFWIRPKYDDSDFRSMIFEKGISPELDTETPVDLTVSREQMAEYLQKIRTKAIQVLDELNDKDLASPIIPGVENYTYLDVITGQIRHIMYNIGYCNGYLREHKLPEADWYSYNEEES